VAGSFLRNSLFSLLSFSYLEINSKCELLKVIKEVYEHFSFH
jgi:hypothetical protein